MLVVETQGVIRGKLKAAGRLRLNCWLEGDIVCSRLEIGRDGYVLGNVTAREIFIEGQVVGTIEASVVHLMDGAFVEGDIRHSIISVHPSASLLGSAIRSRGFAPTELLAMEASTTQDRSAVEQECRANARVAGVDWSRYQDGRVLVPVNGNA